MTWHPVPGHIGDYAVSQDGRVLSMNFAKSGLPGVMTPMLRNGYPSIMIGRKWVYVHALIAETFIGPRPAQMVVNHKDGDKTNNASSNLEYVTRSANAKHACAIGLQDNKGEKHSQSRLTDSNVTKILDYLHGGRSQKDIAREFGIDSSQVSKINTGKAWVHLSRKAG